MPRALCLVAAIDALFCGTPWFMGLSVLVNALLAATVWRRHLRQVRRHFAALIAERTRLGREIHDTLLQSLFAVALQCDSIASDAHASPSTLRLQIRDLRRDLERYMREARESIGNLRSLPLDSRALPESMRDVAAQLLAGRAVAFSFSQLGVYRAFPPKVEMHLIRIAREAIVNALRHGRAGHVRMELCYTERQVTLRVSDDGQGFDPAVVPLSDGHYGLIGMRERVAEIAGKFEVVSVPGRGTRIEACAPFA
jgi:signal transduction histidine kinase